MWVSKSACPSFVPCPVTFRNLPVPLTTVHWRDPVVGVGAGRARYVHHTDHEIIAVGRCQRLRMHVRDARTDDQLPGGSSTAPPLETKSTQVCRVARGVKLHRGRAGECPLPNIRALNGTWPFEGLLECPASRSIRGQQLRRDRIYVLHFKKWRRRYLRILQS